MAIVPALEIFLLSELKITPRVSSVPERLLLLRIRSCKWIALPKPSSVPLRPLLERSRIRKESSGIAAKNGEISPAKFALEINNSVTDVRLGIQSSAADEIALPDRSSSSTRGSIGSAALKKLPVNWFECSISFTSA